MRRYCILENDSVKPRYGWKLPAALLVHAVVITLLVTLSSGQAQFYLFHASFSSMQIYCLYRVFLTSRAETDPVARRFYTRGFAAYVGALFLWFLDIQFCDILQAFRPANPQLHAWWHVLVSAGLYLLTTAGSHRRMRVLAAASGDAAATIEYVGYILPVARLKTIK